MAGEGEKEEEQITPLFFTRVDVSFLFPPPPLPPLSPPSQLLISRMEYQGRFRGTTFSEVKRTRRQKVSQLKSCVYVLWAGIRSCGTVGFFASEIEDWESSFGFALSVGRRCHRGFAPPPFPPPPPFPDLIVGSSCN